MTDKTIEQAVVEARKREHAPKTPNDDIAAKSTNGDRRARKRAGGHDHSRLHGYRDARLNDPVADDSHHQTAVVPAKDKGVFELTESTVERAVTMTMQEICTLWHRRFGIAWTPSGWAQVSWELRLILNKVIRDHTAGFPGGRLTHGLPVKVVPDPKDPAQMDIEELTQ